MEDTSLPINRQLPTSSTQSHRKIRISVEKIEILVEAPQSIERYASESNRARMYRERGSEVSREKTYEPRFEGLADGKSERCGFLHRRACGTSLAVNQLKAQRAETPVS
jgi:hypothetical protein